MAFVRERFVDVYAQVVKTLFLANSHAKKLWISD